MKIAGEATQVGVDWVRSHCLCRDLGCVILGRDGKALVEPIQDGRLADEGIPAVTHGSLLVTYYVVLR